MIFVTEQSMDKNYMFHISFISLEPLIFLFLFFSSLHHHQGISLFLYLSDFLPKATLLQGWHIWFYILLNPFLIARTMNNKVYIYVQYFGICCYTFFFCKWFVSVSSQSSTLLCSFIMQSFKPLLSHCIYRLAALLGSKISVGIYFLIVILTGNLKVVEFSLA